MTDKVIRFNNMKNIDKTLYYQCREYIKLCLLIEELQCFKDDEGEYCYINLIEATTTKANLLLMEFENSLERIKKELDDNPSEKKYACDIHRIYDGEEYIACADTMDDAEIIVNVLNRERTLVRIQRRKIHAMGEKLHEEIDKADGDLRDSLVNVLHARLDV